MSKSVSYDPSKNTWENIPQLPEKKEGAAICTLNNNIYVIGGNLLNVYFKSVWAYCTETKEWVSVADMNTARSYSGKAIS